VYWSTTGANAPWQPGESGDSCPAPLEDKGSLLNHANGRVNFITLSPLLLHLGAGFLDHRSDDWPQRYNALTSWD
jgi:hypothetical protein